MPNHRSIKAFLLMTAIVVMTIATQGQNRTISRIPTVAFCELTSHPEKYVNKLVRTEANYIVWWESSYLYGDRCIDDDHKISNSSDCAEDDQECENKFGIEWKKLEPFMRSKKGSDTQRVKAVFTGRLEGPGRYGHLDGFQYEFRIVSIGKVKAIPDSVSWKGL